LFVRFGELGGGGSEVMAGEHQFAAEILERALGDVRQSASMDEEVFARALMYALVQHYAKTRSAEDVIGELDQRIREIEDGGESVITRGC
jgi:hypothetical protein